MKFILERDNKWWFESSFLLGAYLGAVISSFMGLKWYYTIIFWPLILFGFDVLYQKYMEKKEKEGRK